MSGGLFRLSGWVGPFGFLRNEREAESELHPGADELDLATMAFLLLLDLLTLPFAVLWLAGVARERDLRE
jgi:hypothetical protein